MSISTSTYGKDQAISTNVYLIVRAGLTSMPMPPWHGVSRGTGPFAMGENVEGILYSCAVISHIAVMKQRQLRDYGGPRLVRNCLREYRVVVSSFIPAMLGAAPPFPVMIRTGV